MPQPTVAQRHKVNRDPITDAHIILLEFQEDGVATVHRAAVNTQDVTHQGNLYARAAIDVQFPGSGDAEVRAQLEISNIDRVIGRTLDSATRRINVRLILIDISVPDVAIIDTKNLLVIPSASGGSVRISAQLGPRASLLEPVPSRRTTRASFPGVWLA